MDPQRTFDGDLERIWRQLHASWVAMSDELAAVEERRRAPAPAPIDERVAQIEAELVARLRANTREAEGVLVRFEQRMRAWRGRVGTAPRGYR